MKRVVVGVFGVILLVAGVGIGGLFYLGQRSREGAAAGLLEGRLTPCPPSPNCVSSESGSVREQSVDPLTVRAWTRLPEVVVGMGGTVTRQGETYVAAEFTSDRFGFVDDIEFRLADDAVHVRSASRVGYADRGVNRARVEALRADAGP